MRFIIRLLSKIPLRGLYVISTWCLYPLIFYVVRYRRKLVEKNLRCSFPDKTPKERKRIAQDFYHSLSDIIVEIIYGYSASAEEMLQRVVFVGSEDVFRLIEKHGAVIVMLAHLGNWEWMAGFHQQLALRGMMQANIYRRLSNQTMDALMSDIRRQRGGQYIEKQQVLRQMLTLRQEGKKVLYGFISDQKPRPQVARCWTEFLHQDTGFLDGSEVLAKKFGYPILYAHIARPERGRYITRFELISEYPSCEPDNAITLQFAQRLERNIQEQPSLWLWTHNRWKWGRPVVEQAQE